jgi:DNA mismatch repair protein MSH3
MIQVSHPLCDQTLIAARLNAVSEIAESMGTCNGMKNLGRFEEDFDVAIVLPELAHILSLVLTSLGRAPDIQRGITRIFHRTATPSEVRNSFLLDVNVFHYIM